MSTADLAAAILLVLGGLGSFLIGLKLLQDSTEKLATGGLRKLFAKTSKNPFVGVGIGTLATAVMQSSGATTVMVVGFVNAGVMSLSQATAYIMGANIGTTITAQIVALGDFSFSEIVIALTLIGILAFLFFGKKSERVGDVGLLISGLGLLFLGLAVMKDNMQSILESHEQINAFIANLSHPFLLFLLGILATVLFQSSSAITSIVIAIAMAGGVFGGGGNAVFYLILGTNIGSTSTTLISSIGSSTNGKRAAFIHFLFNLFGSVIFFVFLLCFPSFNDLTFASLFPHSPQWQIAMFHTFFNVVNTILFLPCIKLFVKLSEFVVREKKKTTKTNNELIDERFLSTPAIAFSESIRFYHLIAEKAMHNLNDSIAAFVKKDINASSRIKKEEGEILLMSRNLTAFNVKLISSEVSEQVKRRVSNMALDLADIVRLSEVADNLVKYTAAAVEEGLEFSPSVELEIDVMKRLLNEQYANAKELVENPNLPLLRLSRQKENEIDLQRTLMVEEHMKRLSSGQCSPSNSNIYLNLVSNLERCGDHFNFICERACQQITDSISSHV